MNQILKLRNGCQFITLGVVFGLLLYFLTACAQLDTLNSSVAPPMLTEQALDLSPSAILTPGPIAFPLGFMKSIKDYGAQGDGVTDDTAAIQAALMDGRSEDKDYSPYPKALYFPAGTYLVSDTLEWRGCCVTLQGQGSGVTIIKLKSSSLGFQNPSLPKPVIRTAEGNESFRQNIRDLAVHVDRGNPGAVGIDYIANNTASIRNVVIRSEDGRGVRGLDLTRKWPGPLLVKGLAIYGFDIGIHVKHAEYGPTFEYVILKNQRVAGIRNEGNSLAIRGLSSQNRVTAIESTTNRSMVILLASRLVGGAANRSAIYNQGYLYARNVSVQGYSSTINEHGKEILLPKLKEFSSQKPSGPLENAPNKSSLNLYVRETPEFHDENLNNWVGFTPRSDGQTDGLQTLFDSGKSTIYSPSQNHMSFKETTIFVPSSVRKIVGFSSIIVNRDPNSPGAGGIRFVIAEDSRTPLIIEGFEYGVNITHQSKRTVVLKDGTYRYYESRPGAGDLFLENVLTSNIVIHKGQSVWARQYNNEAVGTKVLNNGAKLWILGLKTEKSGTIVETRENGQTEILGTLVYPAHSVPTTDVAFKVKDAKLSVLTSLSSYCADCMYTRAVEFGLDHSSDTQDVSYPFSRYPFSRWMLLLVDPRK